MTAVLGFPPGWIAIPPPMSTPPVPLHRRCALPVCRRPLTRLSTSCSRRAFLSPFARFAPVAASGSAALALRSLSHVFLYHFALSGPVSFALRDAVRFLRYFCVTPALRQVRSFLPRRLCPLTSGKLLDIVNNLHHPLTSSMIGPPSPFVFLPPNSPCPSPFPVVTSPLPFY